MKKWILTILLTVSFLLLLTNSAYANVKIISGATLLSKNVCPVYLDHKNGSPIGLAELSNLNITLVSGESTPKSGQFYRLQQILASQQFSGIYCVYGGYQLGSQYAINTIRIPRAGYSINVTKARTIANSGVDGWSRSGSSKNTFQCWVGSGSNAKANAEKCAAAIKVGSVTGYYADDIPAGNFIANAKNALAIQKNEIENTKLGNEGIDWALRVTGLGLSTIGGPVSVFGYVTFQGLAVLMHPLLNYWGKEDTETTNTLDTPPKIVVNNYTDKSFIFNDDTNASQKLLSPGENTFYLNGSGIPRNVDRSHIIFAKKQIQFSLQPPVLNKKSLLKFTLSMTGLFAGDAPFWDYTFSGIAHSESTMTTYVSCDNSSKYKITANWYYTKSTEYTIPAGHFNRTVTQEYAPKLTINITSCSLALPDLNANDISGNKLYYEQGVIAANKVNKERLQKESKDSSSLDAEYKKSTGLLTLDIHNFSVKQSYTFLEQASDLDCMQPLNPEMYTSISGGRQFSIAPFKNKTLRFAIGGKSGGFCNANPSVRFSVYLANSVTFPYATINCVLDANKSTVPWICTGVWDWAGSSQIKVSSTGPGSFWITIGEEVSKPVLDNAFQIENTQAQQKLANLKQKEEMTPTKKHLTVKAINELMTQYTNHKSGKVQIVKNLKDFNEKLTWQRISFSNNDNTVNSSYVANYSKLVSIGLSNPALKSGSLSAGISPIIVGFKKSSETFPVLLRFSFGGKPFCEISIYPSWKSNVKEIATGAQCQVAVDSNNHLAISIGSKSGLNQKAFSQFETGAAEFAAKRLAAEEMKTKKNISGIIKVKGNELIEWKILGNGSKNISINNSHSVKSGQLSPGEYPFDVNLTSISATPLSLQFSDQSGIVHCTVLIYSSGSLMNGGNCNITQDQNQPVITMTGTKLE